MTVTAEKDSYTFGETVSAEWEASGLVFDDDKSALGAVSLVYYRDGQAYTGYPESKLLAAGSYTVGAEGFANENYNVTAQSDTFTVEKRQFVVYAFVSGPSGTQLSKTISFFEADDLFEFVGTVVLNTTEEGEYIAKDEESFAKYFFWQDGVCAIKVKGTGEDVTENFAFTYDLSFTLSVQAFPGIITLPSQSKLTYDGKTRSFGIEIRGAEEIGYQVEYSVNGGELSETAPLLTDAGVYSVRYFITAENYEGEDGSYTVTIAKAQATIGTVGVQKEYVYTGEAQTVLVGGKVTYTGDGVLTAADYTFTTVAEGNGHVITVSASEGKNYLAAEAKITLTVQKANYTVSAEQQDYTYNGSAQGAAISVTAFGEDMFTVIYNGKAAVAQYTNADTYTVAYIVSGNDNYNDATGSYAVTINKAEVSIELPSNTSSTYNGTSFSAPVSVSAVDGGFAVTYLCNGREIDPKTELVNAGTYVITYTVSGANYKEKTDSYTVTIKKAHTPTRARRRRSLSAAK